MKFTMDFTQTVELSLDPVNEQEAQMQNIYCLLNTAIAEVPCYRNYGLDKSYIAAPANLAKTMVVSAIAEALRQFFPNLYLSSVDFSFNGDTPDVIGCRIEVADSDEES